MKKFLKDMFSASEEVSSKRVAGFIALINAIAIGYIAIFKPIPQFVFDGLLMFSGSVLAATVVTNLFQKKD